MLENGRNAEVTFALCFSLSLSVLVIDRKRIFFFRTKKNIRQENAAEYSADNNYSAQGSKHGKNE
jgi:hypothetical protein